MTQEHQAKARGISLPISTKQTIEVCNLIRHKSLQEAKQKLQNVILGKTAVPFRRFNKDMGHRKGAMAAGRYPAKACTFILEVLNSVEMNAVSKGLDADALYIHTLIPNQASRPMHAGRQHRTLMKRTHIDIMVEEREKKEPAKKDRPKESAKETMKPRTRAKKEAP